MTNTHTDLVGSAEACRILGISRATLTRYIRTGKIPATRLGNFANSPILIRAKDIHKLQTTAS